MKSTVVIGVGNTLMGDEGVGIHVVRRLAGRVRDLPDVEIADVGTASMRVIHLLPGRRKAVFVDCAFMGCRPGEIVRFQPQDVGSTKRLAGYSLHEGDLLTVIELSRKLGECPDEVVIFGIQPETVAPGEGLAACLADQMARYEEAVMAEVTGTALEAAPGSSGGSAERKERNHGNHI